jgi:hypothetical protein
MGGSFLWSAGYQGRQRQRQRVQLHREQSPLGP